MADHPRPGKSPRPAYERPDDEGSDELEKTDPSMPVDAAYFKEKLGEQLAKHDRKMTLRGWAMAFVSAVVAVASVVILVIIFIDNRVAAQTDAGVKVHEERISTLEQQRKEDKEELDQRLKRIESNANADHELSLGTSQKVDKLLERFNVPNPAPAPKDGGR